MQTSIDRHKAYALRERILALAPPRVLLAEDNDDLRELVAAMLRRDGYGVIEARNGDELQEQVGSALLFGHIRGELDPLSLIISDFRMPGRTGLDVVSELREANVAVAVIILSAFGDPAIRARARQLDVAAFVHKPFELATLLRIVHYYVPVTIEPDSPPSHRAI